MILDLCQTQEEWKDWCLITETRWEALPIAELLNKQFQSVFSSSEEVSREDLSRNYKMPTV